MARKLNREQSLILEEKIVTLRCKGYSYRRIASELHTSLETIHRMLKKTSIELQRRIDDAKIVMRWEEYLIADAIREEALEAFRQSSAPLEIESVKNKFSRLCDDEASKSGDLDLVERTTTRTTATRDGNPAFLTVAIKASERISRIWGLDTTKEEQGENADGEILVFGLPVIPTAEAAPPPPQTLQRPRPS
jgi:hypothetical protein